jgi:hypothetical protein
VIVDEFTGRLMHGRRYNEGLHQAIEAKEGVEVQQESRWRLFHSKTTSVYTKNFRVRPEQPQQKPKNIIKFTALMLSRFLRTDRLPVKIELIGFIKPNQASLPHLSLK